MKSMTGYGRAKYENQARAYIIEIKSVNNRYSEINIKLPRDLSYLEEKIKTAVSNSISRGKIDVFVTFINNSEKGKNIKINVELARKYIDELEKLASMSNINKNIGIMDISKLPDVLNIETNSEDEEIIWNELNCCLQQSIDNFIQMRTIEGNRIREDLNKKIISVEDYAKNINELSKTVVEDYMNKLRKRVNEILQDSIADEQRLAQEIVIYSDKTSIDEELIRLESHVSQFKKMLQMETPTGKKMDFLIQEMNRETNTIGSKANNLEITNLVVEIKNQLENIREQIQNIE